MLNSVGMLVCFRPRHLLTRSRVARRRSFMRCNCSSGGKYCSFCLFFNLRFLAHSAFFCLYSSYLPFSFNISMCRFARSLLFRILWKSILNESSQSIHESYIIIKNCSKYLPTDSRTGNNCCIFTFDEITRICFIKMQR